MLRSIYVRVLLEGIVLRLMSKFVTVLYHFILLRVVKRCVEIRF